MTEVKPNQTVEVKPEDKKKNNIDDLENLDRVVSGFTNAGMKRGQTDQGGQ